MKLLHTADWHLGRVLHEVNLLPYQAAFIDHFVELVKAERPDGVLLAGDVFDRAVAPVEAMSLLDEALYRLAELTQVIIIPGNHDSASRLSFGSRLFTRRVRVVCDVKQVGQPISLGQGREAVHLYPIPYLEPDLARHWLAPQVEEDGQPVLLARSHEAVVGEAMRRINADLNLRQGTGIAIAHAFVAGSATSDSERSISVGGAEAVATTTLVTDTNTGEHTRLRYLACGHLHRPQTPFQDDDFQVRYSGSPLPMSFSEATDHKSTSVLEISNQKVNVTTVEVPSELKLRNVRGSLADLKSSVPQWAGDAYVSVEITDPTRPPQLFNQVRQIFPRALVIRHTGTGDTAALETGQRTDTALRPQDQTEAFFTRALDRELTADERAIIDSIWSQMRQEEAL